MQVRLLLFKTTNMICHQKYGDVYATQDKLFRIDDTFTLQACYDLMQRSVPGATWKDVKQYCKYGTFNDEGLAYLNRRLVAHVESRIKPLVADEALQVLTGDTTNR